MNSPATARNGNRLSACGMTIAVVATLIWLVVRARWPERHGLGDHRSSGSRSVGGAGLYLARAREDDRDAAAGVAVQRGRRRRGGTGRDRRLHPVVGARAPTSRRRSSWSSARSSVRSPSPARSSPAASSRASSPASRSWSLAAGSSPWRSLRSSLAGTAALILGAAGGLPCRAVPRWSSWPSSWLPASIFGITMVLPIGGADMPVVISPAELVHRDGRGDGRVRHRQPGPDHRGRPRRRLRRDPHQAHGRRDEPLDH